jgi:hypothetical protein
VRDLCRLPEIDLVVLVAMMGQSVLVLAGTRRHHEGTSVGIIDIRVDRLLWRNKTTNEMN